VYKEQAAQLLERIILCTHYLAAMIIELHHQYQ
jgi:hypothetical protein